MTKKQQIKIIVISMLSKAQLDKLTELKKLTYAEFNIWENYLNKMAWSFHWSTGIPFEDLQAQVHYLFAKSIPHYKPHKYPLKQHIQMWVKMEMRDYIKKQYHHWKMNQDKHPIDVLDIMSEGNQTDFDFNEIFTNHNNPIIRKAFELILQGEQDREHIVLNGWLDKKLNKLGYQYDEIRASFKQIRMILKEA